MVPEGGSMTILCTALGSPTPTISLYVGGHLVRVETTRTMVTIIQNVSRDMDIVTCLATNGYGSSVQPGKKVYISCKFEFNSLCAVCKYHLIIFVHSDL